MKRTVATVFLLAGLSAASAGALELTFGLAVAPTSVDPHHHNLSANNEIRRHIFESLTGIDERGRLKPLLATSWRALDDTTWSLALRPNETRTTKMIRTKRNSPRKNSFDLP